MVRIRFPVVSRLARLLPHGIVLATLSGCFEHVLIGEGPGESGTGPGYDAGPGGGTQDGAAGNDAAGGSTQETGAGGSAGGLPDGALLQACGSESCAAPTQCCYLTAQCFDPSAQPEACPAPAADGQPGAPCGADAHCEAGEFCANENLYMCMGKGRCAGRSPAGCTVFNTTVSCGCDGTSISPVDGCLTGVRVLSAPILVGCGEFIPVSLQTFCGNNSAWCPLGEQCCGITGLCFNPAIPGLCTFPPDGTYLPCVTSDFCPNATGVCQGLSCGAPGGCIHKSLGCSGPADPVCGCDGHDYWNQVCALYEGVAVDHPGPCQDSGVAP